MNAIDREKVLSMKPGRELDALVAEKVMGDCRHEFEVSGPNAWNYRCRKCGMRDSSFVKKLHVVGEDTPYSTEDAAASEALSKFTAYTIEMKENMYLVTIYPHDDDRYVSYGAETFAESAAKSALLAVMEG